MVSRIRTVKPECFVHEGLYDLERETGLPLRLAYIGLWTQMDREGRFKWRPRALKSAVLPYDELDFGDVLDALEKGGFLLSYELEGRRYGWCPTFHVHQYPNHREAQSVIPPHPDEVELSTGYPPRARPGVPGHAVDAGSPRGEGNGREGKGRERNARHDARPDAVKRFEGSSAEWDKCCELMRRMGFDAMARNDFHKSPLDDLALYALLRDVADNRKIKKPVAYALKALRRMEAEA